MRDYGFLLVAQKEQVQAALLFCKDFLNVHGKRCLRIVLKDVAGEVFVNGKGIQPFVDVGGVDGDGIVSVFIG